MNNMRIGKLPLDLTTKKELVIFRMTVSAQIRKGLVAIWFGDIQIYYVYTIALRYWYNNQYIFLKRSGRKLE